ncbi:DUF5789 family protein [Haloplanus aerogenes]|nr:hypothetical protein [Haloplanus aerogenes]AZH26227.1 hypothetical protein DU502_13025 [Haloplanus aerogenes]
MRYSETHQLFDQACSFPVEHEMVVEQVGDVTLTTPAGDSFTVQEILTVTDETSYRSVDALYTTLLRNLDEAFIGSKYYDDRSGPAPGEEQVRGEADAF